MTRKTLKVFVPAIFVLLLLFVMALPAFFRARENKRQADRCMLLLLTIDSGKWSFAMAKGFGDGTELNEDNVRELGEYLRGGWIATHCPADGKYDPGGIGEPPSCSIHGALPAALMRR